jgi:hypothetical protein
MYLLQATVKTLTGVDMIYAEAANVNTIRALQSAWYAGLNRKQGKERGENNA